MRQRTYLEQLDYERRVAEFDKRRLSDYAWEASSPRKMQSLSLDKLRTAAALAEHEGELGQVGRAAKYELKRRGY